MLDDTNYFHSEMHQLVFETFGYRAETRRRFPEMRGQNPETDKYRVEMDAYREKTDMYRVPIHFRVVQVHFCPVQTHFCALRIDFCVVRIHFCTVRTRLVAVLIDFAPPSDRLPVLRMRFLQCIRQISVGCGVDYKRFLSSLAAPCPLYLLRAALNV